MADKTKVKKIRVPWYLWPFWALWQLIAGIVEFTGRIVAVIFGFVFMLVGIVLSITLVGAVIGIPLIVIGILMVIRGLF